tara:strand:+ start:103 stop:705 length:603 start_codon:yes stop_codon:yes gene_type:complete
MFTFSATEAIGILKPLTIFIIGLVAYSIFIFKIYRLIAERDIFELNLRQYKHHAKYDWLKKFFTIVLYILEYLIIFPLIILLAFLMFAALLVMLSSQGLELILLISMGIVASVRVTAYYNEDLSKDLAKMIPFALIGVLLLDLTFGQFDGILSNLNGVTIYLNTIIYYFLFTVVLEFILRIITSIFKFGVEPPSLDDAED